MFRKLVSNLPYSPSLITEVGFYAQRLRQEDVTRRTALLFVALTIGLQSLAVFSPPESANASSEQDIIRGGVSSLEDFLVRYDNNEDDVKDIYNAAGITRREIATAKPDTISSENNTYIMTRYGQLSNSQNEISMSYQKSSGGMGVRYFSPLSSISDKNAKFQAWIGTSSNLGWFAILKSNGGLATRGIPTTINPASSTGTAAKRDLFIENVSQSKPADFVAKANERLKYTIRQTNDAHETVVAPYSLMLSDVLEYASLLDSGGGRYDAKTKTLSWPSVDLATGESQDRTFIIQMLPNIPATGAGRSNPASYDCTLTLAFGNVIDTPVDCPPAKGIEGVFAQMPSAGIGPNVAFALVLLVVVVFFYLRNRQLKTEIRILRHNFNSGGI